MKNKTQTVLIVDDDLDWLDFLAGAIGTQNHVLTTTNGEDAIRTAQRTRPHLIILDVMMPGGMDGLTVFAQLQRDPRTQNIPVVMLTDTNQKTNLSFDPELIKRHLGKATAAFLDKPVSVEQLMNAIRVVLPA